MSQPPVSACCPFWLNVAKTLAYRFDSWTRLKSAHMVSKTQRTRRRIKSKDWEGHKKMIRARNRRSGTIQRTEEGITTSGLPSSTANMKQPIKSNERCRLKSGLSWNMNSGKTSTLPSRKGKTKPRSRLSQYWWRNKRLSLLTIYGWKGNERSRRTMTMPGCCRYSSSELTIQALPSLALAALGALGERAITAVPLPN